MTMKAKISREKGAVSPWPDASQRKRLRSIKREAVLKAAVESFNRKGYSSTSLDDVAVALNVTKPTIYYYVSSKDEVLFECVRLGLESIKEALRVAEQGQSNGRDRLRALMFDYAKVMTEDFGMCVARTADHELSEASRARFRALKREVNDAVRAVVEQGMEDGSIPRGDSRMITFTLTGALNWIGHWYDPQGEMTPDSVARGAVEVLMQGIAPGRAGDKHAGAGSVGHD